MDCPRRTDRRTHAAAERRVMVSRASRVVVVPATSVVAVYGRYAQSGQRGDPGSGVSGHRRTDKRMDN